MSNWKEIRTRENKKIWISPKKGSEPYVKREGRADGGENVYIMQDMTIAVEPNNVASVYAANAGEPDIGALAQTGVVGDKIAGSRTTTNSPLLARTLAESGNNNNDLGSMFSRQPQADPTSFLVGAAIAAAAFFIGNKIKGDGEDHKHKT